MATLAQALPKSSSPLIWLKAFLKEELAPYPGRAALVARMTIAATIVMLLTMTFRITLRHLLRLHLSSYSQRESCRSDREGYRAQSSLRSQFQCCTS